MQKMDDFASSLLEESKRFLEKAKDEEEDVASRAYLHASLLLCFCALEAHVNAIAEDFSHRPELTPHELAVIQEKDVRLINGEFKLQKALKMFRLEDRIEFLHVRFSGSQIDYLSHWWSRLADATKLRNELTHPKAEVVIDNTSVGTAIQSVVDAIDALYRAIYKAKFPAAGMRLDSELNF